MKINEKILITWGMLIFSLSVQGQVKISKNTETPSQSAILDIESSDKGFLPPRIYLTSNTMLLNNVLPTEGMLLFNTNDGSGTGGLNIWLNGKWNQLIDLSSDPRTYLELGLIQDQVLPSGTSTNIAWQMVNRSQRPSSDYQLWYGNRGSDIIIRRSGLYFVDTFFYYTAGGDSNAQTERSIAITKNGNQICGYGYTANLDTVFQLSTLIYCAANDVIRVQVYNGAGQNSYVGGSAIGYDNRFFIAQMPMNVVE